jgi:hypothetical protein
MGELEEQLPALKLLAKLGELVIPNASALKRTREGSYESWRSSCSRRESDIPAIVHAPAIAS